MVKDYKKIGQKSAVISIVCLVFVLVLFPLIKTNLGEEGKWLGLSAMTAGGYAYIISFWYFAKAKGYAGALGLFLSFLSIFGILILYCLKDKKS